MAGDGMNEPFLSEADPEQQQGGGAGEEGDDDGNSKPRFGLIVLTCLFRLCFIMLYLIPCRPQNSNEGFIIQAEHILFLTAPGLNLFANFLETYAKAANCIVSTASSIGTILIFAAGMVYAQLLPVSKDNVPGDSLWIVGGLTLAGAHMVDALVNFRKGWNLLGISKLFGFTGALMFTAVGFIGPLENTSQYDYFAFKNFIFAGAIFYFVHVLTLLVGQKVNVKFVWRRD